MTSAAKPLIIAEKPSAARAIADALGGFSRREGYLESGSYLLSWAIGHLVEQMAPEAYDPRWKRWSLQSLPIMPPGFGLQVVGKTRSQFELLAKLAGAAPALINACDAGREGELIFRYICTAARIQRPVQRLWVSSLTREAIRQGFARLQPASEYDRLYQSALCRAQGDWLVGMNSTRAFTVKWGELLSVGRVQTPTLALIVRREQEIEAFVSEQYWEVAAKFALADRRQYEGKWYGPEGERLNRQEDAEAVVARVKGQVGTVESSEEKEAAEKPPQLFDLTSLQREANRRFGMTAAATLKSTQALYEAKLITYPRTDSRYLTRDLVAGLGAAVRNLAAQPEFASAAGGASQELVHPGNRRVVDDSKVTDHHAIIPTPEAPGAIAAAEAKVYGLIARRFLAQFYPEARYLELEVITRVGDLPDRFRSRGRRVLDLGWRAVEPEPPRKKNDPEAEGRLPALSAGAPVTVKAAEAAEKSTQPPKRYSEATLLSAMEFAGRAMDDEELRDAMKGRGLGTPATRASIIERLKEVGYVATEKKGLAPTPKGRLLVQRAEAAGAQVLLSAELTGEWERRIADIQAGTYGPDRFMGEIKELTAQVVGWVRGARAGAGAAPPVATGTGGETPPGQQPRRRRASGGGDPDPDPELPAYLGKCPRCSRAVVKGSKGWACANSECGLRLPGYLCGKVIDSTCASALLKKGRTPLITGFTSPRTGKGFSAYLLLKEGKVEFEFPADKPRKASGYRRSGVGGGSAESETGTKAGSRTAGGGAGEAGSVRASRSGVGRRAPGASKPARTGPGAG